MENIFLEIVKSSPILGLMIIIWYFQRKDYQIFVDKVQESNAIREGKYQNIIDKLTEKFDLLNDIKKDVEDVKDKIFK